MKLGYGIIATSAIARRFVGAQQKLGGRVVAVGSRTYEHAKAFADEFGIKKAYGSYEEVYQDTEVNIVYITTVNDQHVSEIKKALQYGKHVLCEKPLGLNRQEVMEVFALAKAKNCFVMEMQKSVFLPITDIVKEYIDTSKQGKLYQIDMLATFVTPKAKWMHQPHQGGVVYGSSSYTLEYLDYLIEPEQVNIQTQVTKEDTGTIDQVSMNIKMDDILINSRISMRMTAKNYAIFYFDNGYIQVEDYWKARSCQICVDEDMTIIHKPIDYEMVYEIEHVKMCIQQGLIESPIMSWNRTMKCMEAVEQIINEHN